MTKKDFEMIAAVVREVSDDLSGWNRPAAQAIRTALTDKFCAVCTASNGRFNEARFRKACGLEG